ncbi:hypothetical protein [uncultured Psychroserpens sp.]|uniref:hypothetical protein n=1 Tax=uncultured Psychroserpens sp. TaxID=255436 RepID=UPI0026073484|nr:hypothetical protein [uncultured Psychroserpens sp.]
MLKARFFIDDKFIITGRGLVFVGHILEGEIRKGNYVEFEYDKQLIKKKIIGIEFTRHSIHSEGRYDLNNIGIMIECEDEKEMKSISESGLKRIEASVFEK